jgi:hypothetical protein
MGAAAQARVARTFSLDRFVNAVAEEIRMQISPRRERRKARHVWSVLGKRFSEMYSTPKPGDPGRVVPQTVRATPALFSEHPLMRKVMAPYATRPQSMRPVPDAVFFLATELLEFQGVELRTTDPRYVFSITLNKVVDRAVLTFIEQYVFCNASSLMRGLESRFARSAIRSSLRRLHRAGIILSSEEGRAGDWRMVELRALPNLSIA